MPASHLDSMTDDQLGIMAAFLEEHFESFVLLGYDEDGRLWRFRRTPSTRDENAMIEALRDQIKKMEFPSAVEVIEEEGEE